MFVTGRYTPWGPWWPLPTVKDPGHRKLSHELAAFGVVSELWVSSSAAVLGFFLLGSFVPVPVQGAVATQAVNSIPTRRGLCHAGSALSPPVRSAAIGSLSHDRLKPTSP